MYNDKENKQMLKKPENQDRGNPSGGPNSSGQGGRQNGVSSQSPHGNNTVRNQHSREPKSSQPGQGGGQPRQQRNSGYDQGGKREKHHFRNYNRDNKDNRDSKDGREGFQKQSNSFQGGGQRYPHKVKTEETIDDIKEDILRIEKEIELEIREIRTMRLGL